MALTKRLDNRNGNLEKREYLGAHKRTHLQPTYIPIRSRDAGQTMIRRNGPRHHVSLHLCPPKACFYPQLNPTDESGGGGVEYVDHDLERARGGHSLHSQLDQSPQSLVMFKRPVRGRFGLIRGVLNKG